MTSEYKVWFEGLNGRYHSEHVGVHVRILLKLVLMRHCVPVHSGYTWFGEGSLAVFGKHEITNIKINETNLLVFKLPCI
jgi:hypothetical protein